MSDMTMNASDAASEQEFLRHFSFQLRRRKKLILFSTAAMFIAFAAGTQFLPKKYTSMASVELKVQTPKAVDTHSLTSDLAFTDETVGTELEIIHSRELLVRVINKLNLVDNPEFNPNIHKGFLSTEFGELYNVALDYYHEWFPNSIQKDVTKKSFNKNLEDTVESLDKHLSVAPVSHSRVIDIAATSTDNILAASIANTVADEYVASHLQRRIDIANEANQFIEKRLGELASAAYTAAKKVEDYRNQHGLFAGERSTLLQDQLTNLNRELFEARAKEATLESQYQSAKSGNVEQLAASLGSNTISRLREQEALTDQRRSDIMTRYGARSAEVQSINSQLSATRSLIAREANRIVQSLPREIASAKANVATAEQRLATATAEAAKSDEARAHLATLESQSKAAAEIYTTFLSRSKETDRNVQWNSPTTSDVSILSNAIPTMRPSFPNNRIMLPTALILSLMLSCTLAIIVESRKKGLVSFDELEQYFPNVRALGMIPVKSRKMGALYQDSIEGILDHLLYDDGVESRSVLITSALPREGKSTTAFALADAAMERGLRVLLVDADMRSVHQNNRKQDLVGFDRVLRGETELKTIMPSRTEAVPGKSLITLQAGKGNANPLRVLGNPRADKAFKELTELCDLVIVDGPPALIGGDVARLCRMVDHTMIVAKWNDTSAATIRVALKRIRQFSPKIAGIAFNMVDPKRIHGYGYNDAVLFSPRIKRYYG